MIGTGDIMSEKDHGRIRFLDGWRGLAIIVVLIGHFAPGMSIAGGLGVDLFFVLSGRLMAQILVGERYPLKQFFIRRFTRIYPALLVFSTAMLIVSALARWKGIQSGSLISPLDYFAALTMWMNYKVALLGDAGVLDHLWSISVEEHCYIILAVLCAILARRKTPVAFAVGAFAICAILNGFAQQAFSRGGEHEIFWRTDVRLAPLFMSFAVRLTSETTRKAMGMVSLPALIAACIIPFTNFSLTAQLACASVLLPIAVNGLDFAPTFARAAFELRAVQFMGVTSYSLYLWQQPFYRSQEKVSVLILLPLAICCALASFYLIEGPARSYLNRRFGRS